MTLPRSPATRRSDPAFCSALNFPTTGPNTDPPLLSAPQPSPPPRSPIMSPHTNGTPHPAMNGMSKSATPQSKETILHLGGPIQHNHDLYRQLSECYNIINPPPEDLQRSAFIQHLKDRTWGNFSAIFRPFWATGNEMKPWDRELIELLPEGMKVMASAGAGFDWVDVKCLAEHGIIYCNGAGASTEAVADMALFFIIGVFRQMMWSIDNARSKKRFRWEEAHNNVPAASNNPRGHTLGIVGLGNIGFAIAKKAKAALDMKIIYNDIYRKSSSDEDEIGATYYEKLDDLLPRSDCLLIATPHTGSALLDSSRLSRLPRGARVVNIARGSLVNEDDLANFLDSGHISAAALDVHEKEPEVNMRLSQMRNVILTSHTGGGSVETIKGFEELAMNNVDRVLTGRPPLTPVNQRPSNSDAVVNGNGKHDLLQADDHEAKRHQADGLKNGHA